MGFSGQVGWPSRSRRTGCRVSRVLILAAQKKQSPVDEKPAYLSVFFFFFKECEWYEVGWGGPEAGERGNPKPTPC